MDNSPEESLGFPGYYEIPGYSKYVISKDGEILNKNKNTLLLGSFNPAGYKNYRLTGDDGKVFTWGRHRLMGFVFKHPGICIKDLIINHKNAIKGDDFLDNLEWDTYQGNAEHAGSLGLTIKCQPISVRDVDTGVIIKYPSIAACARDMGVTKDTVNWRVKAGETKVFPDRKQYRGSHSDIPWYEPVKINPYNINNGRSKHIDVRNVMTGCIRHYEKISDLVNDLDTYPSIVSKWISSPNQPVLPGFIQIKLSSDNTPWRAVIDPYLELDSFTGHRSVVVTNDKTKESKIFTSASECASVMGIKQTALNYRLKSKGKTIFNDNYTYAYYSDIIRSS